MVTDAVRDEGTDNALYDGRVVRPLRPKTEVTPLKRCEVKLHSDVGEFGEQTKEVTRGVLGFPQ